MKKSTVTMVVARALCQTLTLTTASFARSLSSSFSSTASSTSNFALKNVTKSNFDSTLSDLRRCVKEADFVSIDLEMTGVTSTPWRDSFDFDRFDIRYLKVKDSVEKFAVVQFGVCPFRWDSSSHSFIAHPHNFYIFPRQEISGDGQSCEFMCQTASIDFLAKYQFDFNICIREGISYLSRRQEEDAHHRLALACESELSVSGRNLNEFQDTPLNRIADVLFTERVKNRFSEWRDGLLQSGKEVSYTQGSSDSELKFQTIFFKMRPSLKLTGFTSHQLRLIQLVTRKYFKDLAFVRVVGEASGMQHLIVFTESDNDRDLLVKEVKDCLRKESEMKVSAAVGFRHVIDLLSSEKKLIVGHNCFLDMAHIHSKFLGPLPLTAEEYVSSIHKCFPYIMDTKLLLSTNNIFQITMKKSSTSLSKAFALLCPRIASGAQSLCSANKAFVKVEVQVDNMRSSTWNSGAKHEAGYDAFMTGCVFAQACRHLGIDFKLHSPSLNLAQNEKLRKHINLLYLSWINGDVIDLTTGNQTTDSSISGVIKYRYPKILFSNIALVWGLPPKLKAREIKECISKVFGPDSVTSVYHLDETAVFVQFSKAELVSDFLELKDVLERSDGPISVLHPLSKILEGGRTRAASYEIYKEICSSPISKVLFADQAEAVGISWKTKLMECKTDTDGILDQRNKVNTDRNSPERGKAENVNSTKNSSTSDDFPIEEFIDSLYPVKAQVGQ